MALSLNINGFQVFRITTCHDYTSAVSRNKQNIEASATCYLAVLKAIGSYLIKRGVAPEKLPHSIDQIYQLLGKHCVHNGYIIASMQVVYQNLYLFGYYRDVVDTAVIKSGFGRARLIIEKLTSQKV